MHNNKKSDLNPVNNILYDMIEIHGL